MEPLNVIPFTTIKKIKILRCKYIKICYKTYTLKNYKILVEELRKI